MAGPRTMYEPVLISDSDGSIFYQAGAFPNEAEAQKVLDICSSCRVRALTW